MTVLEFRNGFDVLYNNVASNQAPGFNDYEISLFLTKAQEEIVKNYFSPRSNVKQEGFDDSYKRDADFRNIIRKEELANISNVTNYNRFDKRSLVYTLPSDLFISLNEQVMDGDTPYTVVPISFDEYDRVMKKPYKYPPKYMVWRIIPGEVNLTVANASHAPINPTSLPTPVDVDDTDNNVEDEEQSTGTVTKIAVELIGRFDSNNPTYTIRYIKKLNPIILCNLHEDFGNDYSIDDKYIPMTSELPEELHEEILQRAVELAKATWTTTGQDNTNLAIEMGKRSE